MSAIMRPVETTPVCATEPEAEPNMKSDAVVKSTGAAVEPSKVKAKTFSFKPFFMTVLPPIFGVIFLVLVWEIISAESKGIPSPLVTLQSAAVSYTHLRAHET